MSSPEQAPIDLAGAVTLGYDPGLVVVGSLEETMPVDRIGRRRQFRNKIAASVAVLSGLVGAVSAEKAESVAYAQDTPQATKEPPLPAGTKLPVRTNFTNRTVILNITATEPQNPMFIQVYENEQQIGTTSNLNIDAPGQTRPNLVFANVDDEGDTNIYLQGSTHLVVDEQGALVEGTFDDIPDIRLLDTRGPNMDIAPLPARSFSEIHGQPGRTAVVNLTVTQAQAPGFLQILTSMDPSEVGKYSNLNYATGNTIAGLNFVKFNDEGKAFIYNLSSTHVVADIQGYFIDGFEDLPDTRVMDTREAAYGGVKAAAGSQTIIRGRPNSTAIVSLISTENAAPGFLQVLGPGSVIGTTSNVNMAAPGGTYRSLAFARFDANGEFRVYTTTQTHIVADIQGYMEDDAFVDTTDNRLIDSREGLPTLPIEIPPQYACDKAIWLESYRDPVTQVVTYKHAIYDLPTNQVTRYNAPDGGSLPYRVEIDPSTCNTPAFVFSKFNPATGHQNLYRRVMNGSTTQITTPFDSVQDVYDPDALVDQTYYINRASQANDPSGQRIVVTTGGSGYESQSVGVEDYAVSDARTMYAEIRKYVRQDETTGYQRVTFGALQVRRVNWQTQQSEIYEYTYPYNSGEHLSNVEVNSEGTRTFVLRSVNNGLSVLHEVIRTPAGQAQFLPVTIPGVQPGAIYSFRAIGASTIVAVIDEPDGHGGLVTRPYVINLTNGTKTDMSVGAGADFQSALM